MRRPSAIITIVTILALIVMGTWQIAKVQSGAAPIAASHSGRSTNLIACAVLALGAYGLFRRRR